MFEKLRSYLQPPFTLSKVATIVNWVCFTPIILIILWGTVTENEDLIIHPLVLLASAALGFAYAVLLSIDTSNELFRRKPLLNDVPRWLWRWICAGWGAVMLVIFFFVYISPF